jgi:PAS domain S-box-containing protein
MRGGPEGSAAELALLRRELETARGSEARLAAIVQASDDAMFSLRADLVIDTWNPGAERLLGYTTAEMIGQSLDDLMASDRRPRFDMALQRLQAGERSVSADSWTRRKDGSLLEVAATISSMHGADGRLAGYAMVLRDLTERRRAEADLAAARTAREVLAARERIARDLHDDTIQAIFAVGMRLQATATMSGDPAVRERLQAAVTQLDTIITDLRRHVFGYQDDQPEDGS